MKKQFTIFVLFLAVFGFSECLNGQTATAPSVGDGSLGSPYEIATWENLYWISQNSGEWDKHYKQTADIDLSAASPAITGWDSNQGWTPIGNIGTNFTGSYDGQDYTINGLYINRSSSDYIGLFGNTYSSTISNLGLTNVDVTGITLVGGLVGLNQTSSTIQNSYSSGSVSGNERVGGLVGMNWASTVENSYSTGSVTGSGSEVGGLVGYNFGNGMVQNSYSTGSVTGSGNYVGGLVGSNFSNGMVQNSYSTGSVSGVGLVGGLVGINRASSTVENSYSTGSVTGSGSEVGGLVGINQSSSTIQNSYSAGSVSGSGSHIGGLVGYNTGNTVTDSFWDTETSGQTLSPGGGTGKTTSEMKDYATFTDVTTDGLTTAWDFVTNPNDDIANNDHWDMDQYGAVNNGYPILSWQTGADNNLDLQVAPSVGDGSLGNPYEIATWENLYWISQNSGEWGKHYIQTADIDLSAASPAITEWDANQGWSPIGNNTTNFTGSYDGQDYTINGLFISRSSSDYMGLFGYTDGSTISNLGLTNVDVTGRESVGGLVGINNDGSTTQNSYSTGSVTGDFFVGGLVGINIDGSTTQNSYSTGSVTGSSDHVGGLVGGNWNSSTIQNSYSTGSVSGNVYVGGLVGINNEGSTTQNSYSTGSVTGSGDYVGGLVGYNQISSTIQNSYSSGSVSGVDLVGGLVGYNRASGMVQNSYSTGSVTGSGNYVGGLVGANFENNSAIENSYSTGSVSGNGYVGGLVGINQNNSTIQNSYSAGSVSGSGSHIGGLVGYNTGNTVTDSFWDTQTSGQNSSDGGTGKTTAQMQSLATFTRTDSLGLDQAWDFVGDPNDDAATNDYWDFNDNIGGYPFLAWQNSMSNTIPGLNTNRQSFASAGVSVQFTTGNTGEIQLNIIRIESVPNVFGSLPSSVQNLSQRYWSATVTSGSADGTYDITFDITGLDGVVDCYTLKVLKRNDSSSDWEDAETLGGTLDFSGCPNTLIVRGLSGFSDFVIGGGADNPLPVELSGFSGVSTSNGIELSWMTQSETNNAGFVVLRNGIEIAGYKTSEALKGHGSTSNKQTYAYIDGDVSLNETYTYELISVDYSGARHSYSQTVEVKVVEAVTSNKPLEYALEQNYPNPFNPSTTIKYTMKEAGVATLKVFDMLGRVVLSESIEARIGQNVYNFNGQNYSSGVYFYQLNAEGFSKTLKMMLVK